MAESLTIEESRQLMRMTQRLCRPPCSGSLLADAGLAEDLGRLFQADFIGSTRWNPARRAFEDAYCVGREREMAQQYVEQFQFDDPISPQARLRREPTLIHAIVPRQELMRTRYYGEFLRPFKTVDGIDLYLYHGEHNVGDLRIWRGPGRPPLGEHELALLALLRPYLLNAMLNFGGLATTGGELGAKATEGCEWACFDHLPKRGAQAANPAAEQLLRELGPADAALLHGRIDHVARSGRPSTWDEFTLCVMRADDSAMSLVQLVPVLSSTGAAQRLEQDFGLTPREAQVCLQLAAGRSDDQIAGVLGISYWTVRSHLRKVFTKFDVANRVELTRVLMAPNQG